MIILSMVTDPNTAPGKVRLRNNNNNNNNNNKEQKHVVVAPHIYESVRQ